MNYTPFRSQIPETHDAPMREPQTHSSMTLAHVDIICEIRRKMLFSLKGDIPTALADMLDKKIKHEDAALRTLLGADEKKAEMNAQMSVDLRSEYFIQKSLDANLL
ncbi:hypothetical protein A2704_00775 [Candidatus Kaiserbacteria bacterium RIFCSPHIGHO2_01_FULL_54_36b]|uniref:Uncharacterized protein n=1 Tax=Candidatus Kaiserbacteria bacterium RIFCSPHIGHO2_01_FULL_54_36b TaxID=1798483 RepID=A0A1F6CQT2_9BACT|nr:MAG: hypothetical protein A2704_00775 [Candidatus Kaiserbacteria bacterium RIFCSPHIGHO2_01_FULL_54_36b]